MHTGDQKTTARTAAGRRVLLLTVAAIVVGSVILVIGMLEEPYHIDELRQVRSYSRPMSVLIELSYGQEQPPLDPILGKVVQRVLGQGHVQQRLHPTILGMGVLALLAMLLWRTGLRIGTPSAVLVYSIVPVVVGVTAYARQYALPIFLSLTFLLAAERWLRARSRLALVVVVVVALSLPLARSVEPLIFLAAAATALILWRITGRTVGWAAPVWPVAGSAIAGLVVVGLPVLARFRAEASEFISLADGLMERTSRLVTDLPVALAESASVWPVAAAVLILASATPAVRRFLATEWWIWPLIAIPFGFAGAFFLLANTDQPFFLRYTYSWWLPFAVLVGVAVESAVTTLREHRRDLLASATVGSVAILVVILAVALGRDLTRDDWVDYEPLGTLIEQELAPEVVVYFDNLVPLGNYRAGYAGYGRFTAPDRATPSAPAVVRNPTVARPDAGFVVAISGPPLDVPGWTRIPASTAMNLYLPHEPIAGPEDAGHSLILFGRAAHPSTGAMLRLAGASLLFAAGDLDTACTEVADIGLQDAALQEQVAELIRGRPLADAVEICAASR